jgi:hypothetical protein
MGRDRARNGLVAGGTRMSQNSILLAALQRGESITTLEAMSRFGVCRLSQRIIELEAKGYAIDHAPVHENGKRYVRYSLRELVA